MAGNAVLLTGDHFPRQLNDVFQLDLVIDTSLPHPRPHFLSRIKNFALWTFDPCWIDVNRDLLIRSLEDSIVRELEADIFRCIAIDWTLNFDRR